MKLYKFINLNMRINVCGNSCHDNNKKNDTSLFVQKPYLKSNYIESKIEEDIDLKNQYRFKNYLILLVLENQLQKSMLIIYSMILVY